jgi:putative transposase
VTAHQADFKIATMCRVLGISRSGYYAWVKRVPSRRSHDNTALTKRLRTIHAVSRGTYGAPRVHAELAAQGIPASRNRVARVMREANIIGVSRRKFVVTTVRDGGRQAPDLVDRAFTADAPNVLWVADITYVPTWMGFLYLAVVLDVFSRRIVGWSMSTTLHVTVVLDALSMALTMRRPRGVIHHSDQGSQYTSIEFGLWGPGMRWTEARQEAIGVAATMRGSSSGLDFQFHQSLRGEADHLTQEVGVGSLLQQLSQVHDGRGHCRVLGSR